FWVATILAVVADILRSIALAAVALDLTHRPSGLATLQTIGATPNVLIMLFGGLAADRFRPHTVFLAATLIQAVAAAWVVVAALGQLAYWHLIVFVVVGGVAGGLTSGSIFSVVPDLLPAERLRGANALSTATENLCRFLVPPVVGLAVAVAGAPTAFAVAACIAVAVALPLGLIRAPTRGPTGSEGPSGPAPRAAPPLAQLMEGLRASRQDGAVWALIWVGAVLIPPSFAASAVGLPSLAKLSLSAGDSGIGILLGAVGAGALVGALAAGVLRSVRRPGIVVATAVVAEGVLLVGVGLAPTLWIAAAALVLVGFVSAVRFVLSVTVLQTRIPAAVRGRVMAVATFAAVSPQIPVLALAGYVGDALGPRSVVVIGGVLVALGGAILASRRSIRHLAA
ncbi:MAG TPA: MFS transporter, partial [Solirubrobacteraceae bacterium]